jgi:hypothetical protein
VRLTADLAAKRNVALPAVTQTRYVATVRAATSLTVTSPLDHASVTRLAGHRQRHDRHRQHGVRGRDEHRRQLGDDGGLGSRRVRRLVQHRRPSHGRDERAQRRRREPYGRDRPRPAHDPVRLRPGTLVLDVPDPDHDDNGPGNYAYPDVVQLPRRRVRHRGLPGLRRGNGRHLPAPDARPVGDRSAARSGHSSSTSTCTTRRPRRQSTAAANASRTVPDRAGFAWSRLHPGAGLRPALRGTRPARRSDRSISGNAISRFITFRVRRHRSAARPGPLRASRSC